MKRAQASAIEPRRVSAWISPDEPAGYEFSRRRGDRGARETGALALDTEFMGEGRYRTLLCLIQLAVAEDTAGASDRARSTRSSEDVDAARSPTCSPTRQVEIVVHAGRQDIALLRRGCAPR